MEATASEDEDGLQLVSVFAAFESDVMENRRSDEETIWKGSQTVVKADQ